MSLKFVWDHNEEVDEECIKYLEDKWNVKFPKEYVEIVKKHNGTGVKFRETGGRKKFSIIKIDKHEETSFKLLSYSKFDEMQYSEIANAKEAYDNCVPDPKKMFPFSEDGGGNPLFFDYRKDKNEPSIVYLNHEQCFPAEYVEEADLEVKSLAEWQDETLKFVANSFHELIEKIEPEDYMEPLIEYSFFNIDESFDIREATKKLYEAEKVKAKENGISVDEQLLNEFKNKETVYDIKRGHKKIYHFVWNKDDRTGNIQLIPDEMHSNFRHGAVKHSICEKYDKSISYLPESLRVNNKLKWYRNIETDEESIRYLENKWNVKFPEEYVEIVKKHNGSGIEFESERGLVLDSKILIEGNRKSEINLLGYTNVENMDYSFIFGTMKDYKGCLPNPEKMIPFADDCEGNIFLFDYRYNENDPQIVFLDHEESLERDDLSEEDLSVKSLDKWQENTIYFVAGSFHEMLNMIEPDSLIAVGKIGNNDGKDKKSTSIFKKIFGRKKGD